MSEPNCDAAETRSGDRLKYLNTLGMGLCFVPLFSIVSGGRLGHFGVALPIGAALILAFVNLARAFRALAGTSLRPATVWAMLAAAIASMSMLSADMNVPGSPREGLLAHLAFLATLASLVSVLGARKPGESAWAILCGLFLLIGLLPMLEGIGLARRFDVLDRLRLESPWTYFFVLVIFAGVSNYLPTRFVLSAALLGAGLAYHLSLLWTPDGRADWRGSHWFVMPWSLAAAVLIGTRSAYRRRTFDEPKSFHALWFPFRDAWGAAWALRVLERFNQTAVRNAWPVRLHWFGLFRPEPAPEETAASDDRLRSYEATLTAFLRRFGDPDKIRSL